MRIIKLINKKQFDYLVAGGNQAQFLQSWQWGELQKIIGNKIIRLGVKKNEKLLAVATIIKKTLPAGKSYFYCPRGPILISDSRFKVLELLFKEIKKIADEEKAVFLRFEPVDELPLFSNKKIIKTIDVQPSKTLILDLGKSEEELLKNMRQKTRYNIRLAKRKGVKIIEADNLTSEFREFWDLINKTKNRDGFRIHNKAYYKKMLKINFIKLILAKYEEEVISAGIFSFFGDTVVYMHGASANKYRNVMAPYLLQWQVIKKAKNAGYKYYDFYGIDEKKWPGVTRFKYGFSGKEVEYPGTFDLVFNSSWYFIYKISRKIRRVV